MSRFHSKHSRTKPIFMTGKQERHDVVIDTSMFDDWHKCMSRGRNGTALMWRLAALLSAKKPGCMHAATGAGIKQT